MSEELYELDRAIDRCRDVLAHKIPDESVADVPALLQTFHVLWEELRHLELIHRKMHRLRTFGRLIMSVVMMDIEEHDPQVRRQLKRELASMLDFVSPAPFNLHGIMPQKRLPKDRLAKGQAVALVIGERVIEVACSGQEYAKGLGREDRASWWPDYLNELTWLHDRALLDYLQPASEGQKSSFEEGLARGILFMEEKDRESHGGKKLSDELRHMNPPLTWGEVVYHILQDPETTKGKRGRALREFLSLFRGRYCLECDELFVGPKSSPRLTCESCYNRLRKRKERRRKNYPQV